MKKNVSSKRPWDPYKKKVLLLQDFFLARGSSSKSIHDKFGIVPSKKGRRFFLSDCIAFYSEREIDKMLDTFSEATNPFCGCKEIRKFF